MAQAAEIVEHPLATKAAKAYAALRRAIITGHVPSDAPLKEGVLIEQTGFGRTPIREALKRLAHEGFLVWTEQRSPFIRSSTASELAQLTEARMAVEIPAARLAAARMSFSQLEHLRDICEAMARHQKIRSIYEITELDFQFHTQLALFSGNRFLFEAVSALDAGALRLWYKAQKALGPSENSHAGIIEALARRDEDAVEREVREHVAQFQRRQLDADSKSMTSAA